MSEQQDVISDFGAAGVLDGARWAYSAATSRTLEVFSEPDGHDAALFGNMRFTYFRDRLDRVFSCGRYEVRPGGTATDHLDLLYAELTPAQIAAMPQLPPDLVARADLNGSPGWAFGQRRILLAACVYGQISTLPWSRKSPTKQRVARQPQVDPAQDTLFTDLADEELAGIEALVAAAFKLDLETFVVAHSLDVVTQDAELVMGRPRHNVDGGKAWHWSQDLLRMPPGSGVRLPQPSSPPSVPDAHEPDAPVRLRPAAAKPADHAVGDE